MGEGGARAAGLALLPQWARLPGMKVCILGATGGTGRAATGAALDAGHTVGVLVRDPTRLGELAERVQVVQGNVTSAESVHRAVTGSNAVISALGPDSFRKGGLNSRAAPLVVEAMRAAGARRLVVVSGAGVDVPGDRKGVGPRLLGRALRVVASGGMAERQQEAQIVMSSGLDWVLVRPPHLVDGPATGRVRAGSDLQLGLRDQVTRADLGRFLVDQLTDTRFVGQAPFIAALT